MRSLLLAGVAAITMAFVAPVVAEAEPLSLVSHGPALSSDASSGLDLNDLAQRLRHTEALGVFAKLTLKERLDALISDFALFHEERGSKRPTDLKARFDSLLTETVAKLRNGDPTLSTTIAQAHHGLWMIVSDPVKFADMRRSRTVWREDRREEHDAGA